MPTARGVVVAAAALILLLQATPSLATDQRDGRDELSPDQYCDVDELMHLLGDSESREDKQTSELLRILQDAHCDGYGPHRKDCELDGLDGSEGHGPPHDSEVGNGGEEAVCSRSTLPFEEDAGCKQHRIWSDPTKRATRTSDDSEKTNKIVNCLEILSKQLHYVSDRACKSITDLLSSAQTSGLVTLIKDYAMFNESACGSEYLKGFDFDVSNKMWVDINECRENTSGCAHECENTFGSFRCKCRAGYVLQADQKSCQDIDECRLNTTECDQECENTDGSFKCKCREGFSLMSDGTTCIDVDECRQNKTICSQLCVNTIGSYKCTCKRGYFLMDDKRSCDDRDECRVDEDGRRYAPCAHICTNMANGFMCSCRKGYVINMRNPAECLPVDAANAVPPSLAAGHKSQRQ